jgi:hypothetical protein
MPTLVQEAHSINKSKGNNDWHMAIHKEMNNMMVAFQLLDNNEDMPVGHQYVQCHMIFNMKMENFSHKSRFVAGGHMTNPPTVATYARVVSRESICIALTIAALNDLEVLAGDVRNAYLNAPVT